IVFRVVSDINRLMMTAQKNRNSARRKRTISSTRFARPLGYVLAGLALAPFILIIFYSFVAPPVSALMVWRWAAGSSIDYQWLKMEEIAPILPATIIMTEDARYCSHWGVDWDAVQDAIETAESGDQVRGASTISMQTVKNLFLWPTRSYVRKGLEVPLAYFADFVWGKTRMMEIYLNIVEWAPGIYGAAAAAHHHFDTTASQLTDVQAARLAAILPSPLSRSAGSPGDGTRRLSRRALARGREAAPWITCITD
ncbi:MAG: monofunctional biosynthetic peptidoglycan transglycosylase, partial [Fimbriimonadaceae bacterium]|nr:monofunctional biosynthetic peptidoglycan transglycosylase [Alphaproteobacteria bacterium]